MRLAPASAYIAATLFALAACDGEKTPVPKAPTEAPAAAKKPAGFVDATTQSGIAFKMSYLPGEQGEKFKTNLYDHGCGVAVADVDGDGFDDVYFLNELGGNALYRNEGKGRFADVTAKWGVGLGDRVCLAAAFGDVDNDGDQDLYVTSVRGGNVFFRNDGGRFVDATKEAGLTLVAHSETAAFFDYDSDGALDLFVTNTAKWTNDERDPEGRYYVGGNGLYDLAKREVEFNVLYKNDGKGRFTDVTESAGVGGASWGGDVAVLDYDDDGRQDFLVGNMFGASRLYHNEGAGQFKETAKEALGRTSWGAVGTKAFDYDADGRMDLMIVDMHSDMWLDYEAIPPKIDERRKYGAVEGPLVELFGASPAIHQQNIDLLNLQEDRVVFGNTLFHNLGGGKFEEVSDKAGVETWWPWGIAAADFDMDGGVDLFIPSGMGYPFFHWRNYLLMNRGDGTFEDRSGAHGIDPPPGGKYLDLQFGQKRATKSSRAGAVLDYDGDGRPDLVVNNFNDKATLFHNEFEAKPWTGFRLTGTRSNRDAVGAVVSVRAGGRVQIRQVEPASGYLAQSTKTLLFGLGGAAKIDSCEIRWPDGRKQRIDDVKWNAVNAVTEP